MSHIVGSTLFEETVILTTKNEHHASVESGSVVRTERLHTECILMTVRPEESSLVLISKAYTDLMITGFVVKTDKYNRPLELPKLSMASSQRGMGYSNG